MLTNRTYDTFWLVASSSSSGSHSAACCSTLLDGGYISSSTIMHSKDPATRGLGMEGFEKNTFLGLFAVIGYACAAVSGRQKLIY
jgi:hypothetical protein